MPARVTSATGNSRPTARTLPVVRWWQAATPDPQVARVVGFASSQLFEPKDPFNPINRRIDIVVLTKKAQRAIEGDQPPVVPTPGAGAPGEVPVDPNAIPSGQEPLPAHELRQKLEPV